MCNHCYHLFGRNSLADKCKHTDKLSYAKGMCQTCYFTSYNQNKRDLVASMQPSESDPFITKRDACASSAHADVAATGKQTIDQLIDVEIKSLRWVSDGLDDVVEVATAMVPVHVFLVACCTRGKKISTNVKAVLLESPNVKAVLPCSVPSSKINTAIFPVSSRPQRTMWSNLRSRRVQPGAAQGAPHRPSRPGCSSRCQSGLPRLLPCHCQGFRYADLHPRICWSVGAALVHGTHRVVAFRARRQIWV